MSKTFCPHDMITAQDVYEGLLQADITKMTRKQRESYNQIVWVVNLTDCSKAVEIVKVYLKEFEIYTAGVVQEVFGIDLNENL